MIVPAGDNGSDIKDHSVGGDDDSGSGAGELSYLVTTLGNDCRK